MGKKVNSQIVRQIDTEFTEAHKAVIRSLASSSQEIKNSIHLLGEELAKEIVKTYFIFERQISTPMGFNLNLPFPEYPHTAIVTTKDDFKYLAYGIGHVLENCIIGYMDFRGLRGIQALNAKIRHMKLPEPKSGPVNTLIIGKAVLATGCTAISLTKTAMQKYMPRRTIVATVFYSQQGVNELLQDIPNIDVFLIGKSDQINSDGMLEPGIGNLY